MATRTPPTTDPTTIPAIAPGDSPAVVEGLHALTVVTATVTDSDVAVWEGCGVPNS